MPPSSNPQGGKQVEKPDWLVEPTETGPEFRWRLSMCGGRDRVDGPDTPCPLGKYVEVMLVAEHEDRLKEVERRRERADEEIQKWEEATGRAEGRAREAEAALAQRDQQVREIDARAFDLIEHLLYADCGHCGQPDPERYAGRCDYCNAVGARTAALRAAVKAARTQPSSNPPQQDREVPRCGGDGTESYDGTDVICGDCEGSGLQVITAITPLLPGPSYALEVRERVREALRKLESQSVHMDPPSGVKTPVSAFVEFQLSLGAIFGESDIPAPSEPEEGNSAQRLEEEVAYEEDESHHEDDAPSEPREAI